MIKKKDKKGVISIIILFLILFTILIIGFVAVISMSVLDFASDELTPIMKEVGQSSENENISEAMNLTFDTTDTVVQAMPWVIGFAYVMMLIFSLVFIVIYRENPHPGLMGFYIALVFLLILGSIIISNMYQDIYSGTDEIAQRMQEQTLMSHMVLFSPFIMLLIAFISGIILFAGGNREDGGI